jgi:hypothetical protein
LGTLFAKLAIGITMVGVAIGQSLQEVDYAVFFRDGEHFQKVLLENFQNIFERLQWLI